MFAIICRRRLRIPRKDGIFVGPQSFSVLVKLFSSGRSSSDVNGGDPTQCFTVSYLVDSCGLSSKDAVSVSQKLCIKSRENADAVLELLSKYGFANDQIPRLVIRWPVVLRSHPDKTLLPKLEFFRSIGVPDSVSARTLSTYPTILARSLENYLIPSYKYLRSLVPSDEDVANVFARAPLAFAHGHGCKRRVSANIAAMRKRGVPEASITLLVLKRPSTLMLGGERFTVCLDTASELGLDVSKIIFINAFQVFAKISESTLRHKMDVYRRHGWSESDITDALSRDPFCMKLSEEKITANMDFFVKELGLKPSYIARRPVLLGYSLEKRMRPRWLVTRILEAKGLMEKSMAANTLFLMPEKKFVQRYILDHQDNIPQLLDIYRGKVTTSP